MSERIESIEDVARWIAAHDGREEAHVAEDQRWKAKTDERLDHHAGRLLAIEKRIMWFSGLAAAGGGVIGSFLTG